MGSMNRRSRGFCRKNCSARFVITTTIGAVFGLFSVFRFHRFPFTGFTFRQILVVQNHYLRDLQKKPKYLVTFTVGIDQMNNIYKCVKKFSEDFQTSLFHYDGRGPLNGTDWSGRRMQSMLVEGNKLNDLGVEHFNADRYIKPVKKHDLEISQPGSPKRNLAGVVIHVFHHVPRTLSRS
ncbi:nudix hydrolase 19 [Hibiscus syriacus]|uniref:Nudix hydrolase 19 n=1 Tax=Hibiscus syriacus TaxID=106335 RepID=A0A6A2YC77_HIBSY|nr:nudix hydrolase 19 [Hibiscus syriacus]